MGIAQKADSYKAQKVSNCKESICDPFSHHMTIFQSSSSVWLLLSCWELEGWVKGERGDSLLKSQCSLPSFGTFSAGASHYSHNRLWKRGFRPVNSYRRQLHSFVFQANFIVCCWSPAAQAPGNEMSPFPSICSSLCFSCLSVMISLDRIGCFLVGIAPTIR